MKTFTVLQKDLFKKKPLQMNNTKKDEENDNDDEEKCFLNTKLA